MTADKPTSVVPELRFPEFRSAGDWHLKPLSDLAEPISDRAGTTVCVPMSVTTGVGLVSQDEKFGRTIAGDSYKNYIRLQRHDFAYNKSSTKDYPQGYIARYSGTKDAAVPNSIFTCFRPNAADVVPEYLDHLFHGNHHGRWLRKYITVGARAHGALSVSDDDLMSMPVPLPPDSVSRCEQQKIADCLRSLDEMIRAEGRKLEALRQHKNGLMRQLFPQPGETSPVIRFLDFDDGSEWQYKQLPDVATNLNNMRVPIASQDRLPGKVPYYGATGVVDYVQDHLFDEGLLCVSEDGANLVSRTYPIAFSISGRTWVNNHAHVLRFEKGATQIIVQAYLNHIDLTDYITGVAQPKLNRANLDRIPIVLPPTPEEQFSIAGCISSFDRVLAMQQQKIELLSTHKRGMQQRLFPDIEDESL